MPHRGARPRGSPDIEANFSWFHRLAAAEFAGATGLLIGFTVASAIGIAAGIGTRHSIRPSLSPSAGEPVAALVARPLWIARFTTIHDTGVS